MCYEAAKVPTGYAMPDPFVFLLEAGFHEGGNKSLAGRGLKSSNGLGDSECFHVVLHIEIEDDWLPNTHFKL